MERSHARTLLDELIPALAERWGEKKVVGLMGRVRAHVDEARRLRELVDEGATARLAGLEQALQERFGSTGVGCERALREFRFATAPTLEVAERLLAQSEHEEELVQSWRALLEAGASERGQMCRRLLVRLLESAYQTPLDEIVEMRILLASDIRVNNLYRRLVNRPDTLRDVLGEMMDPPRVEERVERHVEGIVEGLVEGRAEGRLEGGAEVLLKQLRLKFETLEAPIEKRVRGGSEEDHDRWTARVLTAESLEEIFLETDDDS